MQTIPWPALLAGLIQSGLTQPQLAAAAHCGQSTISDLLNGKTADPRTSTGLALIRLANERCAAGIRLESALIGTAGAPAVPAEQQEARDAA